MSRAPTVARPRRDVILIVAASARMLAQLAVAEGYEVVAADLFGDLDLRACARRVLCPAPGRATMSALVALAERTQAPALIYGGGLENRPDLLARLSAGRRLLGNDPQVISRVRDPARLGAVLRAGALAYPRTLDAGQAAGVDPRSHHWLRKPLRGGGGRGVRDWHGEPLGAGEVVQERVPGLVCSAVAVANGRRAVLLGLSEQLSGRRAFGARGYSWCGNVVPPRLPERQHAALWQQAHTICQSLAAAFELRGLFGVDLVWDGRRAWVIEVNPRPPGSLEAIEAAGTGGTLAAHVRAFDGQLPDADGRSDVDHHRGTPPGGGPARAAAKAIVYAPAPIVMPDTRHWQARGIRDIPAPGQTVAAGHPVCTLLSVADSPQQAFAQVASQAARLRLQLRGYARSDAVR